LEISQTLFEDKKKRIIIGEDVYQDAWFNYWKLDSMINVVQKEILAWNGNKGQLYVKWLKCKKATISQHGPSQFYTEL
jgi:hypothetical protein